jgi:hypothetical protein
MADQAPWPIDPPTPTAGVGNVLAPGKLAKPPDEPVSDKEGGTLGLRFIGSDIVSSHTKYWFPDMTGWRVSYGEHGPENCQQTWIAPWFVSPDPNYADPKFTQDPNGYYALPWAIRQLLSWNRERYDHYNTFWDNDIDEQEEISGYHTFNRGKNSYRRLVVTGVELVPRPDLMDTASDMKAVKDGEFSTIGVMSLSRLEEDQWSDSGDESLKYLKYVEYVQNQLRVIGDADGVTEDKDWQQRFPRMRSQYWQVNLTWGPDPYINRYGIRYAKMEIQPSLRMESLKNVPMGVVPTDQYGQPAFDSVDPGYELKKPNGATFYDNRKGVATGTIAKGRSDWMQILSTGFPVREPQVTIRLTYPWVSLENLLKYGPIGNPAQLKPEEVDRLATVGPMMIPEGLYLGCVNKDSFLGYSRGRVLYNSAEVSESVSPITGKIGYRVMHEFLINPNMEWNQTRYTGDYEPYMDPESFYLKEIDPLSVGHDSIFQFANGQSGPSWKTGFVVQLQGRTGNERVYRIKSNKDTGYQAVYPYPYKQLNDLLYYGLDNTVKKDGETVIFDPFDTKEG